MGYDYFWQGDRLVEEVPLYADGTPAYDAATQWLYKGDEPEPFARYEKGQLHYVVCDQDRAYSKSTASSTRSSTGKLTPKSAGWF